MKRIRVSAGIGVVLAMLLLASARVSAQSPDAEAAFKQLSAKAVKAVNISLDQSMLQFAGMFMNDKDADEAQAKKIIANLKGVYVHSFEFSKPGGYSDDDISALRAALKEPEWSRIINVNKSGKDEEEKTAEIYFRKEGDKIGGLAVIAAEPRKLTFVEIVGDINPQDLAKLSGQMGIPNLPAGANASAKKPDDK